MIQLSLCSGETRQNLFSHFSSAVVELRTCVKNARDLPVSDEPRGICLDSWANFWIMPSDWTGSSRLWHCHVDYAPGRNERLIQPFFSIYPPSQRQVLPTLFPTRAHNCEKRASNIYPVENTDWKRKIHLNNCQICSYTFDIR